MKFILFKLSDSDKKNIIKKINLGKGYYINQICLSKENLDKRLEEKTNFIQNIKNILYDRSLKKKVLKALEKHDKKWYYVLSKDFLPTETNYLTNKLQELLGYKYTAAKELDNNIFKYMEEHTNKLNAKVHDAKVLVVWSNINNFNLQLIKNLIKEFKNVNIYLNNKPSSYILKQIKQVNKNEGTAIEIVKKEKKSFTEYNLIYFADDLKHNYPRFRMGKDALIIDESFNATDKFNSNIIFMNDYMSSIESNEMYGLIDSYNKLELASIIRKIVN